MHLKKFFGQPTTIAGLATLCGTAEAMLTGHLTWQAAIPLAVGALVGIAIPDNTALAQDAETLASAAVKTAIDAHEADAHPVDDKR
jgi:hypothetical protein